jgi:hypothetical protein
LDALYAGKSPKINPILADTVSAINIADIDITKGICITNEDIIKLNVHILNEQ